ncbi:Bifunctional inhibitor/plant lipid transfer protein/seed storage helical domain [Arabidopsis thaliana x Arabidopsis arenosa]|uniref:Bifunctional inhibitor/plant lipid transfer protein/seed storage helical domain n=1 Tax=Arabidopsis thaliana x Arabidopsis arenosa TaxID=1240361 RepID=A0A8T1YV99_9BRAS|nr:Bifunctional inhibitor/plant lipid transfer protein/seed storage helical domain [Arabidopsis thaliana x Arabidopsis arenosa]
MAFFSTATSLLLLVLSVSSPYVHGNIVPADDCTPVVVTLIPCLPFITVGSTADTPSASCCSSLQNILSTKPECLCEGLKNPPLGIKLNVTKSTTLPAACKINAPPASACDALAPATPPAATPPTANGQAPATSAGWGSGWGSGWAPAPSPSKGNSLIPISGFSFVISTALAMLFPRI